MHNKPYRIQCVLFDFDGTLTQPGAIDFPMIRRAIGCPSGTPILEFIDSLSSPAQKQSARETLDRHEMAAARATRPNIGAEDVVLYLKSLNIPVGILSRNSLASIERALENFPRIGASDFDFIGSRELPVRPKPRPDGILYAARQLDIPVDGFLMVGDYLFDIQAGRAAGAMTVFISNGDSGEADPGGDRVISRLPELIQIVRMGVPLPAGKLPNDLLADFISSLDLDDPAILVGPGVGEDIAAVSPGGAEVLILKSDPITFVTDAAGHYAVLINANDIATAGATPRWFLSTLLFPCGATASEIHHTMNELQSVCRQWDITLCGGHTEITDAVTRPVISGMLVGTVAREGLIDKRQMAPGDHVLLTKAVAVEGTSIIAREFGDRLKSMGMAPADIDAAREFLNNISVLDEARLAAGVAGVHAMHDVTEGGLATALAELSTAGGHRIHVHMDRIPVFPQTETICRMLDLDPLGLIGSGSLLICCDNQTSRELMVRIRASGIPVAHIGEVTEGGAGVLAFHEGQAVSWPQFERDELARLY